MRLMTTTETEPVDEIADWLAESLASLGLTPVADELTELYNGDVPTPLRRLRLAAALAGVCERMMWDALREASVSGHGAGALEAASRQGAHSFDPGGDLGADDLNGMLFGLLRQQRVFSARVFDDPANPSPNVTDPLLFAAGLAVNVAVGVVRFGMAYAKDDIMDLAQQAGTTFTTLDELRRFCGYALAPPEVHAQRGTDPRKAPPPGAWSTPDDRDRPAAPAATVTDFTGTPMGRREEMLDSEGWAPSGEDCRRCELSRGAGGVLCVCGHDWGCHTGTAGEEPCTHCGCPDMCTP